MRGQTIRLATDVQRRRAHQLIDEAPIGYVMKLGEETRRDAQNRKLWPMIQDVQAQVPEMREYNQEDIKLRFMDALGSELRFLPKLEGQGMFPVGHRSSQLTVQQFAGLIEILYQYGAKHGVNWNEPIHNEGAAGAKSPAVVA